MKCLMRECVQKTWDLRYFKMHSSRRKGLIGTRNVRRCISSLCCPYDDFLLSFWQVERGTLPTSRMWMAMYRYASVVDMLPIDNGAGA